MINRLLAADTKQEKLELSCTDLAHRELESVKIVIFVTQSSYEMLFDESCCPACGCSSSTCVLCMQKFKRCWIPCPACGTCAASSPTTCQTGWMAPLWPSMLSRWPQTVTSGKCKKRSGFTAQLWIHSEHQLVVSGLIAVNIGHGKKQSELRMDFIRLNTSPESMSSWFT